MSSLPALASCRRQAAALLPPTRRRLHCSPPLHHLPSFVRHLQITGELGSDKGVHFIKDFNGQPGYWGVRLGAASAAEQPAAGERPAGGGAAEAAQPLQDPQQQQADQRQQQHPGAPPKQAAQGHRAAMPSPPVPGNDSEAAPWAGATCQYLTDRLWKRGVAVWWPAEQQYFSGKIIGGSACHPSWDAVALVCTLLAL